MYLPPPIIVTYAFSALTPAFQVVDIFVQWYAIQNKPTAYIVCHITYLCAAFVVIGVLIHYIRDNIDGPEAVWMRAQVALCGFSMLLGISTQGIMAWRMFRCLGKVEMRLALTAAGFAAIEILSFEVLSFILDAKDTHSEIPPIIIALGGFWAYSFLCCIAICSRWGHLSEINGRGLLCCALINSLGAVSVLAFLPLIYTEWFLPAQVIPACILQLPWIVLQACKRLPESFGSYTNDIREGNNVISSAENGVQRGPLSSETNRSNQPLVPVSNSV